MTVPTTTSSSENLTEDRRKKMAAMKKDNAQKLAEGYSPIKRGFEYFCIAAFSVMWFYEVVRVARFYVHSPEANTTHLVLLAPAAILGLLLADFFSGLVHWALDTWGTPDTVFFGSFIRSFREHHVDQTAITRHDFVETNGDNMMVTLPTLAFACYCNVEPSGLLYGGATWHTFILFLTLVVAFTNQCHKWSHQYRPDAIAKVLMASGLLLTPSAHRKHHCGAFDKAYCITNGWLNDPLDKIDFWRLLEESVTATTGAIPRANDKDLLGDN